MTGSARSLMPRVLIPAAGLLTVLGVAVMSRSRPAAPPPGPPAPFVDATAEAGLDFRPGLPGGLLNIQEIAGSGCGFLDYDRDGLLDLLLLGWDHTALYRNEGGGRFRETTSGSGLPQKGQWIGLGVADYDNDGYSDLFLSGYDCVALLRNEDGRRFRDVTPEAWLRQSSEVPLFATGAAWGDYDRDGWVDLYIARYVHFRGGMQEHCRSRSGSLETCNPDHYQPQKGSLYRNVRGRRFEDVTRTTGAHQVNGKCWGGVFFDYNEDGWPDLYLANDEVPGDLLHNQKGRRFSNVGVSSGVAFDGDGRAHGAMGSDVGDYDRDGRLDLVVTTFTSEAFSLYRNNGDETFTDRALVTGIGIPTSPMVGWGTRFLDFDDDGWEDLLFVNGHATDSERYSQDRAHMRQPMQLFRNLGGHFTPVPLGPLEQPMLARGLAVGDYDNDGDQDLLVMDMGGSARLLRNEQPKAGNRWMGARLTGTASNRDALGARIQVKAGGVTQVTEVRLGGGLYSAHDPRVRFGLGRADRVDELTVRWPSGQVTRLKDLRTGEYLELKEPTATR